MDAGSPIGTDAGETFRVECGRVRIADFQQKRSVRERHARHPIDEVGALNSTRVATSPGAGARDVLKVQ